MTEDLIMSTMPATSDRSVRGKINYEIWRTIIKNHPLYPQAFQVAVERQKRGDAQQESHAARNIWISLSKEQTYSPSTLAEFGCMFLKIVYCLIHDYVLPMYTTENVDMQLQSLISGTDTLVDIEEFIVRLLKTNDVSKKRMQATLTFYTNTMNLPRYYIPSRVELPKDRLKRARLRKQKTMVLKDDFIDPIMKHIENEVRHMHHMNDPPLYRACIAFLIMRGTGLRIANAYQITLRDLELVHEKGEHKVMGLSIKHGITDFCFVNQKHSKSLRLAIELYKRSSPTLLNDIKPKSSTRNKDFQHMCRVVFGNDTGRTFKSTMVRNYVADAMMVKGESLNKTSRLMNHKSTAATKHYLNQFHPGPALLNDDEDSDEAPETGIVRNIS